jgi:hypothetical protein
MSTEEQIVSSLRDIQRAAHESDEQFAARLSIARTTWTLVRSGQRRPGRRVLGGARAAFPQLERQIVDFLLAESVAKTPGRG